METAKEKSIINKLLKQYPGGVLIESRSGKMYLLYDHYKYIRPEQSAVRVFVGAGKLDRLFKYFDNLI